MVNIKEVEHLAKLSRLGLSKKELQKLQKDLGSILGYVEKLGEVDVTEIKPISHITGLENIGREDEVKEKLASAQEVVEAVPEKEGRWVRVVRVLNRE